MGGGGRIQKRDQNVEKNGSDPKVRKGVLPEGFVFSNILCSDPFLRMQKMKESTSFSVIKSRIFIGILLVLL